MKKERKSYSTVVAVLLFLVLTGWWATLQLMPEPTDFMLELFSGTYGIMALFGAILGLSISRAWGGARSYVGRAILMFSLGLLAQEFGQISYSLYTLIFNQEIPYPSIGDIGYFGSVLLYIYGVWLLGRAIVIKFSFKSYGRKISALLLPLLVLASSYVIFLRNYELDWANPLVVFLDFGYPLGQAVYLSLALLVYVLSRRYLGGVMRPVVLFLLFALGVQYLSDFMFLYQTHNETWTTAGLNDYMYLVSYFVMTLALWRFKRVLDKIGADSDSEKE